MAGLYRIHSDEPVQSGLRSDNIDRPRTWSGPDTERYVVSPVEAQETSHESEKGATLVQVAMPPRRLHDSHTSDNKERMRRLPTRLMEIKARLDSVRPRKPFTLRNQLQRTLLSSWLNVLLLLLPVGITMHEIRGDSVETFAINFLVSLPIQSLAQLSLDEIFLRLGDTYGSLLYITTCNIAQFISCILLLRNGEVTLLQTTLIGGILANILLILGLSFLLGGTNRVKQYYNVSTARVTSNMLSLAATSLLIPTASKLLNQSSGENLVKQSRGASVILITVYFLFLFFQLKTHNKIFKEQSQKSEKRQFLGEGLPRDVIGADADDADYDERSPELYFSVAVFLFITCNIALFFIIDYVVNSINALTTTASLSKTFIGVILLPILNSDLGTVISATKDEMDLVIHFTIGKCLQTAFFVTPFLILLSWWTGLPAVTLVIDGFEIVSLFAAILLLNFVVSPGESAWIQGILLLADWSLIAIAAFFTD